MSYPVPKSVLYIEGDATGWGLTGIEPGNPPAGRTPVELAIMGPLVGTLILVPDRVGSFALIPPPLGDGWLPTQKMVTPYLYIPKATGLPSTSPVYMLAAPDDNLAALQSKITAAMTGGTTISVQITSPGGPGVVILNGALLPFAVLGKAEGAL
jgi:hypothetical protein